MAGDIGNPMWYQCLWHHAFIPDSSQNLTSFELWLMPWYLKPCSYYVLCKNAETTEAFEDPPSCTLSPNTQRKRDREREREITKRERSILNPSYKRCFLANTLVKLQSSTLANGELFHWQLHVHNITSNALFILKATARTSRGLESQQTRGSIRREAKRMYRKDQNTPRKAPTMIKRWRMLS